MGCCVSVPPTPIANVVSEQPSFKTSYSGPRRYSLKSEPRLPHHDDSKSNSPRTPDSTDASFPQISSQPSHFQMKMQKRRSELLQERERLKTLQNIAFNQQLATQRSQHFQRLYDVWEEFADGHNLMDINGLTRALAVFGIIINTSKDFQRHVFSKFDVDDEGLITYNDFSATLASFVGSNKDDDSLQTLFEIFDIDNDGYLEIGDMARLLLAQNQIAVVVTGQQETQIVYTKGQCLKQARRMVASNVKREDMKISFPEFERMMESRTEDDMMIDHMQMPSISVDRMSF